MPAAKSHQVFVPSNKPMVSIIIPHWNGIDVLSECLESLQKTHYSDYEVIVVDNASSDKSAEWIKENHSNIVLVQNEINYGYAGGCNRGAEIATGDYIVFLNNDTIQDQHWLTPLVNRMESDSTIAAIQPKILNYFQRNLFDYAGGAGGHMDIFCFPFTKGRLFLFQEIDKGQYNTAKPCFWASGTAIMVRKDKFEKAGGFDEIFFAHMEEIDLCWRFHAMGFQVWSEPKSIVFHKNAVSMPMYSHQKYYLNHRNSQLMLFGNYSLPLTLYLGFVRFMLEWIAFGYALFKLDWNHLTGILRAFGWLIFHPHRIWQKRKHFKQLRQIKDKDIIRNMAKISVVVEYYIKRRKTYSDIESRAA